MFVVLNNSSGYCNVISYIDIVVFGYNIIFFFKDKYFEMLCFYVLYNRIVFDKILLNDMKYVVIVCEFYLQFDFIFCYFKFVFGDG